MSDSVYLPKLELAEQILKTCQGPVFVTDKATLQNRLRVFKQSFPFRSRIFYAMKANYNPSLLKLLKAEGVDGIDTVSPFEIKMAKLAGYTSSQIIFTGNGSSDDELKEVHHEGVLCNIGSISELLRFAKLFPGAKVSLRFNPGIGDGENKNVITGGEESKFGIRRADLEQADEILQTYKLSLEGLHCHIGSGFYKTETFSTAVENILNQAKQYKGISFVDVGGGFGVRFDQKRAPVHLESFGEAIRHSVSEFEKHNGKPIEIRFEPGKFLVAESTCLLTRVTTRKKTAQKDFVCVDTGFHHLIRPALYGSIHEIVNLSRPNSEPKRVTVVGNVCESTDVFSDNVEMNDPQEGDILAIVTAGAYGASMSSLYNLRPYANEVLVEADDFTLTRKSPSFDQMLQGMGFKF